MLMEIDPYLEQNESYNMSISMKSDNSKEHPLETMGERNEFKLKSIKRCISDNSNIPSIRLTELYIYEKQFEEICSIGKGSFGNVFKARHKLDEMLYAIKKVKINALNSKKIEQSLKEVKMLAKLDHVNIVPYKQAWIEEHLFGSKDSHISNKKSTFSYEKEDKSSDDTEINKKEPVIILYIQMTLCEKNLREWMNSRTENSSMSDIKTITKQILSGLNYIHNLNIIHHDIKPKNILISLKSKNIKVQLGDFGFACMLKEAANSNKIDEHSRELGSPLYTAPEQWNRKCSTKSDIYSFGIVLLELLHRMEKLSERSEAVQKLKKNSTEFLCNLHPEWTRMITESIHEEPTKRPSAKDLLETLKVLDKDEKAALFIRIEKQNIDLLYLRGGSHLATQKLRDFRDFRDFSSHGRK